MSTQERYLNPFTDFGFKKLFGSEVNKDLLIHFLNAVLPKEAKITYLKYLKSEHVGHARLDRRVIYDLYCENQDGEKFIVELQKARQKYFKERTIFYSTFPLQEQAETGEWNFNLKAVYTVSILDFLIEDNSKTAKKQKIEEKEDVKAIVKLVNVKTKKVFYEKLTYVYIQIPLFSKTEDELETLEDKWFYVIQNLQKFKDPPAALQERIFDKVFKTAELAQFDRKQRMAYEDSLKYYRDVKNVIDTAKDERSMEIAENFLKDGLSVEIVAKNTKLSIEEVRAIAKSSKK